MSMSWEEWIKEKDRRDRTDAALEREAILDAAQRAAQTELPFPPGSFLDWH